VFQFMWICNILEKGGKKPNDNRGVQKLDTFSQMRTFNNLFHPPLVALMVLNQRSDFLVRLWCDSALQYL